MLNNTVPRLNLIMYGTEISYHYRVFINVTVCQVTSLALTKTHKQLSTRTQPGSVSGLIARQTIQQKCSPFAEMTESCRVYICWQKIRVTMPSLTLS
jgi:hypothetical protein